MKVIKLNRRFRQFKEHGHTVALRFESVYSDKVKAIETACRQRLGGGWGREHDWYSYYGKALKNWQTRPYWITFRRESDLTLVLLSLT
jgi:hypothetical protein